jgi:acetyl-CoA C-acetyltransferase
MTDIWFAAGVRTPFAEVGGALGAHDAIQLSVPVVRHMVDIATPDFAAWGTGYPT